MYVRNSASPPQNGQDFNSAIVCPPRLFQPFFQTPLADCVVFTPSASMLNADTQIAMTQKLSQFRICHAPYPVTIGFLQEVSAIPFHIFVRTIKYRSAPMVFQPLAVNAFNVFSHLLHILSCHQVG
jgi:hypothetical protein